jgi:radical SAM superfamily enzyme YgiQ (UPF0313 family)
MQRASSWATAWPPITLALLGTFAQAYGEVRVVDGNVEKLTMDSLLQELRTFGADLVVINTGFPSIDEDMAVAQKIKTAFPATKVLAFGVYFTMLEQEAFENYPFLDFSIVGEPEETFQEILKALKDPKPVFKTIKGLVFKDADGIHKTPERPFLQDLDQLPIPDRSLLKNDRYRLPNNNKVYTLINTARGCPHQCTYCIVHTYYGNKVRKHSLEHVMQEIKICVEKFGIRDFLLWEEVFSLDKQYVLALCEAIIKNNLNIRFAATTRVGSITEEVVAAMKKAGCYLIGLGVETGSQAILDRANKKQTIEEVQRAVAICKKAKLATMGHFIFGLPGETKETAEQTIQFMLSLGLDYMQCYCAVPYPKTPLGDLAKTQGWIKAGRWSQYDFGGNSIMCTDTVSCEDVDRFRSRAFSRFYFRPSYILKRIFTDLSVLQLFRLAAFSDWMNLLGFRHKK